MHEVPDLNDSYTTEIHVYFSELAETGINSDKVSRAHCATFINDVEANSRKLRTLSVFRCRHILI
jgi:hypothetical protein